MSEVIVTVQTNMAADFDKGWPMDLAAAAIERVVRLIGRKSDESVVVDATMDESSQACWELSVPLSEYRIDEVLDLVFDREFFDSIYRECPWLKEIRIGQSWLELIVYKETLEASRGALLANS